MKNNIVFGLQNEEIKRLPFLIKSVEEDNYIKYIVALSIEGKKENIKESNPDLYKILLKCKTLISDKNNMYEITFSDYIMHMVRNESYAIVGPDETFDGKYFVIFKKSKLLECTNNLIENDLVKSFNKKNYKHYGMFCENHIIDVISCNEPQVRKINVD